MNGISTDKFDELALHAIAKLLEGSNPYYCCLRKQFLTSKLVDLNFDGYGFTVNFEINQKSIIVYPHVDYDIISGIVGVNSSGQDICGFALFIEDGALSQLDAYSIRTDIWPIENIRLLYSKSDTNGDLLFQEIGVAKSLNNLTSFEHIKNKAGDIF